MKQDFGFYCVVLAAIFSVLALCGCSSPNKMPITDSAEAYKVCLTCCENVKDQASCACGCSIASTHSKHNKCHIECHEKISDPNDRNMCKYACNVLSRGGCGVGDPLPDPCPNSAATK